MGMSAKVIKCGIRMALNVIKRAQASDGIGEIFFKIVTVVGVMEWVCLALWFLYSSLSRLHT